MSKRVRFMEQGVCANCGSGDIKATNLIGGRPGENILACFECRECGCFYIEVYEYMSKGIVDKEDK